MPPKRKITLNLGSLKKKQKSLESSQTADSDNNTVHDTDSNNDTAAITSKPIQYNSLTDFYSATINDAINFKDEETGDVISGPFIKLPPKKIYADYYDLIKNPISINEIRQATITKRRGMNKDSKDSIDGNGVSLDEFKKMWTQMTENASTYNDPDSLIVKDANAITNFVISKIDEYEKYIDSIKSTNTKKSKKSSAKKSSTTVVDNDLNNNESLQVKGRKNTRNNRKSAEKKIEQTPIDVKEELPLIENINNDSIIDKSEYDDNEGVIDNLDAHNDIGENGNGNEKILDDKYADIDIENYDDSDEDYTPDLVKIFRHLLSYKISHHKNSIPLSRALLELPDRDDPNTEDYYDIVTEPMCFNIVGERLDKGSYSKGSIGYKKFVNDINLIFDNALDVFGDGPYYKAAVGLSKAFEKRLEKFGSQVIEKRRIAAIAAAKGRSNENLKNKSNDKDNENDNEQGDDKIKDENEKNNENNGEANDENNNNGKILIDDSVKLVDTPSIIRKHDIEKAAKIDEIDDITAFIKRFTICSTVNLNNFANNLKSIAIAKNNLTNTNNNNTNSNSNSDSNNLNGQSSAIFENIIIEPAGNSTIGGSTYVLQLPGSAVIGHEIACIVHLQNKIVDEKYISELKVNGENVRGMPMSISYDQTAGEDGMFCAGKYGIRLGYGLNYFEFILKVPYPLKNKTGLFSTGESKQDGLNTDNIEAEDDTTTEKRERHERGKTQEFVESVKVWLNITR